MKSEFLRNLGITEQSTIDAIMAENGRDINAVKTNTEKLETQVTELQNQLKDRDTQLTDLKKSVKDNEALTTKITELENANKTATADFEKKIASIQKVHSVESSVRDAKAKNVKAVMALLDMDKITFENGELSGISEQLTALQSGEDTSFLFGESKPHAPAGTTPNNPPSNGGMNPPTSKSLAEAIAKSFNKN